MSTLNTVRTHWRVYEEHTEKQEDGNLPLLGSVMPESMGLSKRKDFAS